MYTPLSVPLPTQVGSQNVGASFLTHTHTHRGGKQWLGKGRTTRSTVPSSFGPPSCLLPALELGWKDQPQPGPSAGSRKTPHPHPRAMPAKHQGAQTESGAQFPLPSPGCSPHGPRTVGKTSNKTAILPGCDQDLASPRGLNQAPAGVLAPPPAETLGPADGNK